jgi:HAD superfamily hydrolase (TIGR01509 family)
MANDFEAVIFDCDGVLVDSEVLGLEQSASYLCERGFDWSPADLVRLFTGLRDDVFFDRLGEAYFAIHGRTPEAAFFDGLLEVRRSRRDELLPVPGAQAALTAMALPIAVASSSRTQFLVSKLKRTGLYRFFDPHIYSADRVADGKPAPDIFLYTAEKIAADPARCLVIEDSENGVLAGCAAGMTVWGFVGGGHCFEGHGEALARAGAVRIVDNFADLASLLDA